MPAAPRGSSRIASQPGTFCCHSLLRSAPVWSEYGGRSVFGSVPAKWPCTSAGSWLIGITGNPDMALATAACWAGSRTQLARASAPALWVAVFGMVRYAGPPVNEGSLIWASLTVGGNRPDANDDSAWSDHTGAIETCPLASKFSTF